MSFASVRFRPCAQALAARRVSARVCPTAAVRGSVCRRCQQQRFLSTSASCRRHGHGLRRATGRTGNVSSICFSGRAEETLLRSAGGTRHYTPWSPSTSEDKTSLNVPTATDDEGQHQHQHQHQQRQQQQPQPPLGRSKPPRKTPEAVAMEEFAALERKLAPPRRKTPEEITMEEFAALEQKLGSASGATEPSGRQGRLRKARASPLTRPEEPDAQECCGNGCATCVWIGYWEELQAWEEAEREREEAPP